HFCKKKGATVGCEKPRCPRSYHYFCALKDNAANDEKPGSYRVYCRNHDPTRRTSLKARVEFLRKCKRAGLLDGIFKEMAETLHLTQEKLKEKLDDDSTPKAEYEKTVISLFDCSLFENAATGGKQRGTEEKIQELLETRKKLDTEMAAVDTQIELLQGLKAGLPASENASSSTSE
ncbi:PREDICTED: PHD finger protein 11-like, partial [Gekko japonicus]|uniref:PHD finger protein 11-like n=1 Tax=Gekko japonicus TaxID=146911 RepID=A0ABM1KU65_GEKJA